MATDIVNKFEQTLLEMTRSFDTLLVQYQAIIQRQQFEVNTLTAIEDISNNGIIDMSHKVAQQTVFTSALIIVPSGTTSLQIQVGRFILQVDNPSVITMLYPIQYIIGGGDQLKITYTPVGTHQGYAAFFGYKTAGNNQL